VEKHPAQRIIQSINVFLRKLFQISMVGAHLHIYRPWKQGAFPAEEF
jgi:hypothetical protein